MNNTLEDFFNNSTIQDLDIVLDGLSFDPADADTFSRIEADTFRKTQLPMPSTTTFPAKKRWRSLVAACLALLIIASLGICAYAADARIYHDAVLFFNDNDLSTEGLSRAEIKAIYRDITTEAFTYDKTAEVILKSLTTEQINGFEIFQNEPTPEYLEKLWNYKTENGEIWMGNSTTAHSDFYRIHYNKHGESCLEKYHGEDILWCAPYDTFQIWGYTVVNGGVVVYGDTPTFADSDRDYPWLSKISENGDIQWTLKIDHNFDRESIRAVIENSDGTYAVFSQGDSHTICISQYDADGNCLLYNLTQIEKGGITNVVRFGDGYLLLLQCWNDPPIIMRVDSEGNIINSFTYSAEDCFYYITDMIEFNGKIYISAYSIPKPEEPCPEHCDPNSWTGMEALLMQLLENDRYDISSEELTPLVKANYTAVLLVCDSESGSPQEFFSADASLGGKLSLDASGNLVWDIENIASTYFSPYTSSFTIGGVCYIFRYTFGEDGALLMQVKTDEFVNFRI